MKNAYNLFLFFLMLFILGCGEDEPQACCFENTTDVVINADTYNNEQSQPFSIDTVYIATDNTLRVKIVASGCSGSSWKLCLIGSESVAESNPLQTHMRFALENPELCRASIEREFTFDMTAFRNWSFNNNRWILNIDDYPHPVEYAW